MTDTTPARAPIGAVGLPISGGWLRMDRNPKLNGAEAARTYREIRVSEPAASAFMNAALSLLRTDLQVVPGGSKDGDKKAAEWLQQSLDGMRQPVATALRQMYSFLWAGWDVHEPVYRRDDAGRVAWADIQIRRQETLSRWLYDDADGGQVTGFVQRPAPDYRERPIPAERYIHLVSDETEGSPEGLSLYRGIYRSWRIVSNLEVLLGIALERFGTGVPVFEVGEGVTMDAADELILQDAIASLRQNEEAGVITPAGVTFRFASSPGLAAGDYLETIRYLRLVMLSTMLADFLGLGTQSGGGAYALGQDKSELFLLALNTYQDRATEALNRQGVRRLFRYPANRFPGMTAPPRLELPAVRRYDLNALGTFMTVLNNLGLITPSPADEAHLRRISDLLDKDEATILKERAEVQAMMPPPPPGEPEMPEPHEEMPEPQQTDNPQDDAEGGHDA
jgi:hypothetical protein